MSIIRHVVEWENPTIEELKQLKECLSQIKAPATFKKIATHTKNTTTMTGLPQLLPKTLPQTSNKIYVISCDTVTWLKKGRVGSKFNWQLISNEVYIRIILNGEDTTVMDIIKEFKKGGHAADVRLVQAIIKEEVGLDVHEFENGNRPETITPIFKRQTTVTQPIIQTKLTANSKKTKKKQTSRTRVVLPKMNWENTKKYINKKLPAVVDDINNTKKGKGLSTLIIPGINIKGNKKNSKYIEKRLTKQFVDKGIIGIKKTACTCTFTPGTGKVNKKKSKVTVSNSTKPKRKLTKYNLFVRKIVPVIRRDNPNITKKELFGMVSFHWNKEKELMQALA